MKDSFYLDYNATAPLRPEAAEAVIEALGGIGNASSVHGFGRAQRRRVEQAREQVAALVGAGPASVVFTASGSEANNLALRGTGRVRLLVSAGEHASVLQARDDAEILPLESDGRLDLAALEAALALEGPPALVSLQLANNETGVIQPLAEAAALARAKGALLHCDAVQAAGRLPLDMAELGADLLTLSAHKLGGPQGVGALVLGELALREGLVIAPLIRGGGQERRVRAGTENVAGIAGFGAAAAAAQRDLAGTAALADLRDRLEAEVRALAPEALVVGASAPRLANTSCIALAGLPAETQVMALDLAGVAVGAGSACSSGKVEASHVLTAMGLSPDQAAGAIRVSLGWASRPEDLAAFIAAWGGLYRRRSQGRPGDSRALAS